MLDKILSFIGVKRQRTTENPKKKISIMLISIFRINLILKIIGRIYQEKRCRVWLETKN